MAKIIIQALILFCCIVGLQNREKKKSDSLYMQNKQTTINIPYNRTTVVADVLKIRSEKYSRYKVTLIIKEIINTIGVTNYVHIKDTITASPNYIRDEKGTVVDSSKENIQLDKLLRLKIGSRIQVVLYLQGSEHGRSWYVLNVEINKYNKRK